MQVDVLEAFCYCFEMVINTSARKPIHDGYSYIYEFIQNRFMYLYADEVIWIANQMQTRWRPYDYRGLIHLQQVYLRRHFSKPMYVIASHETTAAIKPKPPCISLFNLELEIRSLLYEAEIHYFQKQLQIANQRYVDAEINALLDSCGMPQQKEVFHGDDKWMCQIL